MLIKLTLNPVHITKKNNFIFNFQNAIIYSRKKSNLRDMQTVSCTFIWWYNFKCETFLISICNWYSHMSLLIHFRRDESVRGKCQRDRERNKNHVWVWVPKIIILWLLSRLNELNGWLELLLDTIIIAYSVACHA